MTRVMIAVDGSELDAPLASTAYRIFGVGADYWAVNVQDPGAGALGVPATLPAMYGGSMLGFGTAYPYLAPDPYQIRGAADDGVGAVDAAGGRAEAATDAAVEEAGIPDAGRVAEIGDPPEAILRAAQEYSIDVIVVGDHDRNWWSRMFSPAVGGELIERAEIPVLVVSRSAAERTARREASQ